ncbi:hypothetical protein HZS_2877 [Henneguya salminicola]|nr:hypothetical protein HZS_2877 [Henneguya salminicola]
MKECVHNNKFTFNKKNGLAHAHPRNEETLTFLITKWIGPGFHNCVISTETTFISYGRAVCLNLA